MIISIHGNIIWNNIIILHYWVILLGYFKLDSFKKNQGHKCWVSHLCLAPGTILHRSKSTDLIDSGLVLWFPETKKYCLFLQSMSFIHSFIHLYLCMLKLTFPYQTCVAGWREKKDDMGPFCSPLDVQIPGCLSQPSKRPRIQGCFGLGNFGLEDMEVLRIFVVEAKRTSSTLQTKSCYLLLYSGKECSNWTVKSENKYPYSFNKRFPMLIYEIKSFGIYLKHLYWHNFFARWFINKLCVLCLSVSFWCLIHIYLELKTDIRTTRHAFGASNCRL